MSFMKSFDILYYFTNFRLYFYYVIIIDVEFIFHENW